MRAMHAFHTYWIRKFGEKKVPKAREGMFVWLEREEKEQREVKPSSISHMRMELTETEKVHNHNVRASQAHISPSLRRPQMTP